jgi:hypothetical protein
MATKKSNLKSNLGLLAFILIVGVGVLVLVNHYAVEGAFNAPHYTSTATPTPAPTPKPIANVNLSPDNQIVVVSLSQEPHFSITLSQTENTVKFPCSVTLHYSTTDIYGKRSILESTTIDNYGTYTIPKPYVFIEEVPTINFLGSTSFYVVVQDSNGDKITSNTVTVQYK